MTDTDRSDSDKLRRYLYPCGVRIKPPKFFTTETGSRYEVDSVNKRIRRVAGEHVPTARQGEDGEWRTYERLSLVVPNSPAIIVWKVEQLGPTEGNPVDEICRSTMTSHVVEVQREGEDGATEVGESEGAGD